ncbi:hypothetical protein EVAR_24742_1 [Eumeta japonica]|uniref:Uncharacterized protein n=1 Tax=Eumeta variegata TaxID=151549 RepID=A0A4C1VDR7_EUMVA|nr:hypothetical protein EVAR_24742_1 [Eumeta japonica]
MIRRQRSLMYFRVHLARCTNDRHSRDSPPVRLRPTAAAENNIPTRKQRPYFWAGVSAQHDVRRDRDATTERRRAFANNVAEMYVFIPHRAASHGAAGGRRPLGCGHSQH